MGQSWIKFSRNNNSVVNMFCFPYSGASAQVFREAPSILKSNFDVYALELPGRGRRFCDDLLESLTSMVNYAVDGLLPYLGNNDFIFFGHSLGGLLAFEATRELRRRKLPIPNHLYVSGVRAPHAQRREENAHDLPDKEFLKKLVKLGGTPYEILSNREMLDLMVPILRKDFKACETYQFVSEKPLDCPITVFNGSNDKSIEPDDVTKWSHHTVSSFDNYEFKGGHFFINANLNKILNIIKNKSVRVQLGVESPFPEFVAFDVKTKKDIDSYTLHREEQNILSNRACEKRKEEFHLGRAASNSALMRVGVPSPPPVLKGKSNQPIWPDGYVGAITHSSRVAICAVSPIFKTSGIGIDLESLDEDVSEGTFKLVCTEEEMKWVHEVKSLAQMRFKQIFSAKEASFKAFFPQVHEYIDFQEAELFWVNEKNCFSGRLLRTIGNLYPAGFQFEVGSVIVDNFVLSFITLPARN